MNNLNDRDIIKRCQEGDDEAFKMLVQRYYQKAYMTAIYFTKNREVALDISQDAFIRIYKNIAKFQLDRSFGAYLFTIVKNLSRNYLQRYKKRWIMFSDFFLGSINRVHPVSNDREMEKHEEKELLWKALNHLPESDREIILLKDFEDFSYEEISEALSIPIGTVMSRLYYARKKLAKEYQKLQ